MEGLSYNSVIAYQYPQYFSTTVIARSRRLSRLSTSTCPPKMFFRWEAGKNLEPPIFTIPPSSPLFEQIKTQWQLNLELFILDDSPLSGPISISKVHKALRKCGNLSPGTDGIHYEWLRRLPFLSLKWIVAFFSQSWSSGVVPSSWKRAIVVSNPKKEKNPSLPYSYLSDLHSLQTLEASDRYETPIVLGE